MCMLPYSFSRYKVIGNEEEEGEQGLTLLTLEGVNH